MGSTISIEALEGDLAYAEHQLSKAREATARANEAEVQWQTEVTGLSNLIRIRKQRLTPTVAKDILIDDNLKVLDGMDGGTLGTTVNGDGTDGELNKVDWIDGLVAASGTMGIAPPEIMKAAESQRVKMHPNYPYVVLRKLVAKDRVMKRRGRYYKKSGQAVSSAQ